MYIHYIYIYIYNNHNNNTGIFHAPTLAPSLTPFRALARG